MITLQHLTELCKLLNKHNVRYVIIGGCAIFLHGYERMTRDIDLLVDFSDENILKIKEALKTVLPEACKELLPDDVKNNIVVRMVGNDLIVDLICKVGDIEYSKVEKDIMFNKINGVKIPVAGLESMIKLKQGLRDIDKKDFLFLVGKKEHVERNRKEK